MSDVSIHAPAWGATITRSPRSPVMFLFQSTRPRGARREERRHRQQQTVGFNPRARVGRDACRFLSNTADLMFQSTRPRGARLVLTLGGAPGDEVSIHAPAWGATSSVPVVAPDRPPFQSTRPRGARPTHRRSLLVPALVSIHAPAWGATASS